MKNLLKIPTDNENGNVLFIIFIAIALFAALSYAISDSTRGGVASVTSDQLKVKAADMLSYGNRIKAAVNAMYTNEGLSESDINFSHPDAPSEYGDPFDTGNIPLNTQVFANEGGGITYDLPPDIIKADPADGYGWEFLGTSRAPEVGLDDTADLLAVLPHVTQAFCTSVNTLLGYDKATIPADSATDSECVFEDADIATDRFTGSFEASGSANDMGSSNYAAQNFRLPAAAACVSCGGEFHFYMTLLER